MPKKNDNIDIVTIENEEIQVVDAPEVVTDINTPKVVTDEDIEKALQSINDSMTKLVSPTEQKKEKAIVQDVIEDIGENEAIKCRSLCYGTLLYTSPINGTHYLWKDIMSEIYVPFGELMRMNSQKEVYLNRPLIIVEDVRVIKRFNLFPIYEKLAKLDRLEVVFNSGDVELSKKYVKEILECGLRDALINKIRKLYAEDILVNIKIIDMLEKELKYSFSE